MCSLFGGGRGLIQSVSHAWASDFLPSPCPESDHAVLMLRLPLSCPVYHESNRTSQHSKLHYKAAKVESYRELLRMHQSVSLHFGPQNQRADSNSPMALVERISDTAAAYHTHGLTRPSNHVHRHQRWYDAECKALQKWYMQYQNTSLSIDMLLLNTNVSQGGKTACMICTCKNKSAETR